MVHLYLPCFRPLEAWNNLQASPRLSHLHAEAGNVAEQPAVTKCSDTNLTDVPAAVTSSWLESNTAWPLSARVESTGCLRL